MSMRASDRGAKNGLCPQGRKLRSKDPALSLCTAVGWACPGSTWILRGGPFTAPLAAARRSTDTFMADHSEYAGQPKGDCSD